MNVFVVLCWVFLASPFNNGRDALVFAFQNFLLLLGSLALVVFIFMATLRSTQQKLFGKEGYLTFSLPLCIDHILLPKIAINLFWVILSLACIPIALVLSYALHTYDHPQHFLSSLWDLGLRRQEDILNFVTSTFLFLLFYTLLYLKLLLTLSLLHTGKFKRFPKLTGLAIFMGLSIALELPSKLLQHYFLSDPHFDLPDGYLAFYYNFFNIFNTHAIKVVFLGTEILKVLGLYFAIRWLILNKLELE